MVRAAQTLRNEKMTSQEGLCHWCGKRMQTTDRLRGSFATFDHLKRRRDGGSDEPKNMVLACAYCNQKRN